MTIDNQTPDRDCLPHRSLFMFGTLMDRDVLALVSGMPTGALRLTPASATGFSQREVAEENYPVLLAEAGSIAEGLVIEGLSELAVQRILFFEGDEYALADIQVTDAHGTAFETQYFRHTDALEILETSWNFQKWQRQDKADFVARTVRYMRHFGKMSSAEADAFW